MHAEHSISGYHKWTLIKYEVPIALIFYFQDNLSPLC
jgi:hypothetical protein